MPTLLHVSPDSFLVDTFRLGRKLYRSGFRPKHAISIWRGGTPVGLGVDAYYRSRGVLINHTTIATESYAGFAQKDEVIVKNLEHLVQVICPEDGLLIIDDVYESGKTIRGIVELLRRMARANAPEQIVVASVHTKPERRQYDELPICSLYELPSDIWIDYPHELADLASTDDPEDDLLRKKDPDIWDALRRPPTAPERVRTEAPYLYVSPRELLLDCIRLGVMVSADAAWQPDFLIALWPGGVLSGLPIHEVYKYRLKKAPGQHKLPDHISVNTSPGRTSTTTHIVGLQYLEAHINRGDNILIIDTTFRAGRLVNDLVMRMKEALRRNLDHNRVRVASVYYNPEDRSTWTVRPDIRRPHYYLKEVHEEVIYPSSIHKLPNPYINLKSINPALWQVLYGEGDD